MTPAAAPRHRDLHLFEADGAPHLFLANGSRVFAVDEAPWPTRSCGSASR